MRQSTAGDTKVVRGIEVRRDPAREPCFEIVHLHEDVPDLGGMGPEHRRQRLHREYNQEVQSLEIAATCLSDFPDAPWELRIELARQCWDEARHAALIYRRLTANGGSKGQHPIANLGWSVVTMLDSLVARLAIQHRIFEAGSLDIGPMGIAIFHEAGDHATADVLDVIEADEIPHVRFGNDWVKRLTDADPRTVLQIAAAVAWLKRVVVATGGTRLHEIPTDSHARQLAGFSQAEIGEVVRQEHAVNSALSQAPDRVRDE
jgi:uncharacterized ferritin-like protein (DUF455 family)